MKKLAGNTLLEVLTGLSLLSIVMFLGFQLFQQLGGPTSVSARYKQEILLRSKRIHTLLSPHKRSSSLQFPASASDIQWKVEQVGPFLGKIVPHPSPLNYEKPSPAYYFPYYPAEGL